MIKIFIDTNIFLQFFHVKTPLLSEVCKLKEHLILTEQVLNEIDRNKIKVFFENTEYNGNVNVKLPRQFNDTFEKLVSETNKKLNQEVKAINTEYSKLLSNISKSQDDISIEINKLFESKAITTDEIYQKAKIRKGKGNPPGKGVGLGDEINWEHILSSLDNETKELIIVTDDHDYFYKANKNIFVNPFLNKEAKLISKKIQITCYKNLSEALKAIASKISQIKMDESKLEKAKAEEIIYASQNSDYDKPSYCSHCNKKDSFTNGAYLRSRYGGLTWQYVCTSCGYRIDTGDFWD